MEDLLNEFLKSEKALFLFSGIIGVVSLIIGVLFLTFANHKSFAITLIVLGVLEIATMFPTYLNYQQKIENKTSIYKNNETNFVKTELAESQKALKSFFKLKLIYGILIVILIFGMSFLGEKSMFFGICSALILHLAFAITIDNFGEKYTKHYLTEISAFIK
ncbi:MULTISPECIES: hypothetical protein [unclassified Algibacter]|uniref:hypothetical protein n=1 Tax=unclassified Algibacter TaxID=2615009 RepID=UPI00131BAD73|nr:MULTISPECIES: hypothetical protein [unclassified Algibacter]MCL5129551.1 hypothetical protein [Algibacter sp. L4_22]